MNEPLVWARHVGIDVTRLKPRWKVWATLQTTGDIPPPVWDLCTPCFSLMVRQTGWNVSVFLEAASYSFAAYDLTRVDGDGPRLPLRPPRSLLKVPAWLSGVEQKLGLHFRRDRPLIRSTVYGGASAMSAWLRGPSP